MGSRFLTNILLLLTAAFTLVCTTAFPRGAVLPAVSLGLGCVAVAASLAGFALTGRGSAQRALDVLVTLGGAWLIVVSREFSPEHRGWLSLAMCLVLVGLAVAGLAANELAQHRALRATRAHIPHSNGHPPRGLASHAAPPARAPLGTPGRS